MFTTCGTEIRKALREDPRVLREEEQLTPSLPLRPSAPPPLSAGPRPPEASTSFKIFLHIHTFYMHIHK